MDSNDVSHEAPRCDVFQAPATRPYTQHGPPGPSRVAWTVPTPGRPNGPAAWTLPLSRTDQPEPGRTRQTRDRMDILDAIIAILLVGFAISGYRRGFTWAGSALAGWWSAAWSAR